LASVHAVLLARVGRPADALRALTEAERQLERAAGADSPPEWMYEFDGARLSASAGACFLSMSQPVEAERALRDALTALPSAHGRRRAEVGIDLAHVLLNAGELDEAIQLAGAAVETFGVWGSASGLERVSTFAASLTEVGHVVAARSLNERILAASSSR
jgi:tetratricopeptide (TPR) repeat protein